MAVDDQQDAQALHPVDEAQARIGQGSYPSKFVAGRRNAVSLPQLAIDLPTKRAGLPPTMQPSGTGLETTLAAATIQRLPTAAMSTAASPIHVSSPIRTR